MQVLHAPRLQHLSKINDILEDHIDTSFDSLDSATQIQMIIDCTQFRNSRFELNYIAEQQMEQNSRIMCYALHCIRSRSITYPITMNPVTCPPTLGDQYHFHAQFNYVHPWKPSP
jgi:hypothetical protein